MSTQQATILVVDDFAANRLVIERHLERLGHRTLAAENGQQAITVLRSHHADLVLLDIMMPVMNGFETLTAMKADPALAAIPVVMVSALNDVESVARCITLGAEDFLFKPVDRVLLDARVESCLARKRLADREREARAAVEAASRARGAFLSLIAHELRSPLTAILGYADLLLQPDFVAIPQQHSYLRAIHSLGGQMASLLNDLSDLSRIETGHLQLSLDPIPLWSAIESAIVAVEGTQMARRQLLQVSVADNLPLVLADSLRLVQVLTNLLSNACKYTPEGGTITVQARHTGNGTVEVTVRDTGIGIDEAEQAQIFEPFFRSGAPAVRGQPGTGLGLSITRHLVELQGGQIWFTSNLGDGTAFTFTLLTAEDENSHDSRKQATGVEER